jgi:hypothetical protein
MDVSTIAGLAFGPAFFSSQEAYFMKFFTTRHFRDRVKERIGGICPDYLAKAITWSINECRTDLVSYAGRVQEGHKEENRWLRTYKFRTPDGRLFEALLDDENPRTFRYITVYSVDEEVIQSPSRFNKKRFSMRKA